MACPVSWSLIRTIEELVDLLAKAMADGRTTLGENQENEGWPMTQKEVIQLFPRLGEPEE